MSPTGGSFDDITPPMLGESPHPGDTEATQPTRKENLWESDLHNLHIFNTFNGVPMFFPMGFQWFYDLNLSQYYAVFQYLPCHKGQWQLREWFLKLLLPVEIYKLKSSSQKLEKNHSSPGSLFTQPLDPKTTSENSSHNWIIHCEVLLDESISCLHWNPFSIAWICSVPLGQTCGMTSMLFEVLLPWSTSRSSGLPRYDQDEKPSGTHRNQRTPGKNWIRSPTRKVTKRTSDVQSWVKSEASKCIEQ